MWQGGLDKLPRNKGGILLRRVFAVDDGGRVQQFERGAGQWLVFLLVAHALPLVRQDPSYLIASC
jgi:hypothetical protein